jgi:hypothetical protein
MAKGNPNSRPSGAAPSASESLEHTQMELYGAIAPGWEIIESLPVSVQIDEDGQYLLTDEVFSIFGEGVKLENAQQDLIASLIEYYEIISEYQDEPSQELIRMLKKYLRPI